MPYPPSTLSVSSSDLRASFLGERGDLARQAVKQANQVLSQAGGKSAVAVYFQSASRLLVDLASLLRALKKVARKQTLSLVGQVDATTEREIRTVVKQAPKYLVDLARDLVLDVSEAVEQDSPGSSGLGWLGKKVENIAYDPRNLTEGAEALDAIAEAIVKVPQVQGLTTLALEELEARHVLGAGLLSDLVVFLATIGAGGATISTLVQGGNVELVAGSRRVSPAERAAIGASLSRNSLGLWTANLQFPNPLWPAAAIRLRLGGHQSVSHLLKETTRRHASTWRVEAPTPFFVQRGKANLTPYLQGGIGPRAADVEKQVGVRASLKFGARSEAPGWGLADLIKKRFRAPFFSHATGEYVSRPFLVRDDRIDDIRIIEREFKAAGWSKELAAAAIINALAESGLDPRAQGDWGRAGTCPGWDLPPVKMRLSRGTQPVAACAHSIGYFQTHDKGAGHGYTATWRMVPKNNIAIILHELETPFGRRLKRMLATGRDGSGKPVTVADLAYQWCWDIERPSARETDSQSRAHMAAAAFPSLMKPIKPTPIPSPPSLATVTTMGPSPSGAFPVEGVFGSVDPPVSSGLEAAFFSALAILGAALLL